MMGVSDDDKLLQEMSAMVRRYGLHKCQKTLNEVAAKSVTTRKHVEPDFIDISPSGFESCFTQLMTVFLLGDGDHKFSLRLSDDSQRNRLWIVFYALEKYYDSIVPLQPTHNGHQRVQSRFRTLCLEAVPRQTVQEIFARKKVIALFENVVVVGAHFEMIPRCTVELIKQLVVNDGLISSLTVTNSDVGGYDFEQLGAMLEVNRLESLEMLESVRHFGVNRRVLANAIMNSLNVHMRTFADASNLRALDIGRLMDSGDSQVQHTFFNILVTLPRLNSLGITTKDPGAIIALIDCIGRLKVRCLKLRCDFDSPHTEFRALFDAVARSRYIKAFTFGCPSDFFDTSVCLSADAMRQLFDLALSPSSGLLDIVVCGYRGQIDTLVLDDVDPKLGVRRQLRRFSLMQHQSSMPMVREDKLNILSDTDLQALVTLLSKQLPFLHDIGLTESTTSQKKINLRYPNPSALELEKDLFVQIENNRVGIALTNPEVLPTVPGGLWSIVLNRAITCEEDPEQLPWTGIYNMVRKMVEIGCTGQSVAPNLSPCMIPQAKRRKMNCI